MTINLYIKRGDASKCLYLAADKQWWVANTADMKAGKSDGFAHSEAGLPHPTLAKAWQLNKDGVFQPQQMMMLVTPRISSIINMPQQPHIRRSHHVTLTRFHVARSEARVNFTQLTCPLPNTNDTKFSRQGLGFYVLFLELFLRINRDKKS